MPPEGMVHALETVHNSLIEGGILVDIHPTGQAPLIKVEIGEQTFLVGYIEESDNFVEYAQADSALRQAVANGWFNQEKRGTFLFKTYAVTVAELKAHLEATWSDAIFALNVQQRAAELLEIAAAQSRPSRLTLNEQIGILRLRTLSVRDKYI
jgi:hypothetical protein